MITRLIVVLFSVFLGAPVLALVQGGGGDSVNNGAGFRESQMVYIWSHLAEDLATFTQTTSLNADEVATVYDLIAVRKAFPGNQEHLHFKKESDYKFPIGINGRVASFATQAQVGSVIVVNQDWLYRHTTEGSYLVDYQESFLLLTEALLAQKSKTATKAFLAKIAQWLNAEIKIINLVTYGLPQIQTKLVLNQVLVNDEAQVLNLTETLRAKAPCGGNGMQAQNISFTNLYYADVTGAGSSDTNLNVEVAGKVSYECQSATQNRKFSGEVQWGLKFARVTRVDGGGELRFHEELGKLQPLHNILYYNLQAH